MREVLARVKAMLRRRDLLREEMRHVDVTGDEELKIGGLTIDPAKRRIHRGGTEIHLKPREFDLLVFLARHPGQVLPPDHLIERVWGYDALGDVRTVRVHVRSLREKLEDDPSNPVLIETVRGVGYRLAV
jgi:DNA-binding response OmpR family regulator